MPWRESPLNVAWNQYEPVFVNWTSCEGGTAPPVQLSVWLSTGAVDSTGAGAVGVEPVGDRAVDRGGEPSNVTAA